MDRRERAVSTVHFALATVFLVAATFAGGQALAQQGPIKPYKDELFSRFQVLESADGGAYEVIDYQELRDINERDQEPERRVKSTYVSTAVRRVQENEMLQVGGRAIEVARVGKRRDAAFTVIFVHGRGGDRRLGVNDYSFGGNFNRLKNLAVRNGGTYYAPSVVSFDASGTAEIALLIRHAFEQSRGRPVLLACASMGGMICSGIARDREAVHYLSGMAVIGGPPDAGFLTTPAAKRRMPIYLSQGSADSVYPVEGQAAVYRKLRAAGYPVRLTVFNTGGHGTPIRMTDWRKLLNFLLTAD
ncbi:MAG: alpha/beta hydrolase [Alphaproteobacteria bacterium]|nr:alpha/beta hydrolase [Alphaproteobacteria bacterium]MBU1550795.1 alpha/beta hydrolase [Alphaproteobacteria bacterium]MBU2338931.1 alpha/beta hydrolase [Alphaproteobacteria bacterium]MBU2387022.1 alpha/beta hydrolase [Alphaproteobacteria bacterium]